MVHDRPTFPLPPDFFASGTSLSTDELEHFRAAARTQLDAVMHAEHTFVYDEHRHVNSHTWRLFRKALKLRVYRRRLHFLQSDLDRSAIPTMLAAGQVDGTIERVLAGLHATTSDELRATLAFIDPHTRDAALLQPLETARPDDPLRSTILKWTCTRLSATLFALPRDWCFVESHGVSVDALGQCFGFLILQSVKTPQCPPFDECVAVRASGSFAFVLRDGATANTTDVFALGLFDASGDVPPSASMSVTTDIFLRLNCAAQCADAKMLTLMAVRNYRAALSTTVSSGSDPIQSQPPVQLKPACYLCGKQPQLFSSSLQLCVVCGATACAKCCVKRRVFMGNGFALCAIASCKTCLLAARSTALDVVGDSFLLAPTSSNTDARRPTIWRATELCDMSPPLRSVDTPDTDARLRSFELSVSSDDVSSTTSSDDVRALISATSDDLERIVESMAEQKWLARSQGMATADTHCSGIRAPATAETLSPELAPRVKATVAAVEAESPQTALFDRMVALQSAAYRVHALTLANGAMMRKL